jgi:hypothetical protein
MRGAISAGPADEAACNERGALGGAGPADEAARNDRGALGGAGPADEAACNDRGATLFGQFFRSIVSLTPSLPHSPTPSLLQSPVCSRMHHGTP